MALAGSVPVGIIQSARPANAPAGLEALPPADKGRTETRPQGDADQTVEAAARSHPMLAQDNTKNKQQASFRNRIRSWGKRSLVENSR